MATAVQPSKYIVSGTIYDEHNLPLTKVIVKLYEIDLRAETFAGEKVTDERGAYELSFEAGLIIRPEQETADLRIKVFGVDGVYLGQSPIYFNVGANTIIDFKVGGTTYTGMSEFDQLLLKVKPVVEPADLAIGQLEENEKHQDISFLAGELKESIDRIYFLNTAFAFTATTRMPADIFYALFRMGFPENLNIILLTSTESIEAALKRAIEQNIISSKWTTDLDKVIQLLNNLAAKKVLSETEGDLGAVKKTIAIALSDEQQKLFLDTYFASEAAPEKFWEKLKQQPGITEGDILKTQQVLRINLLTEFQPELTGQLFNEEPGNDLRAFSVFTKADWQERIKKAGVVNFPPIVSGNSFEEKLENYAGILAGSVQQLFPTNVLAAALSRDGNVFGEMKPLMLQFFAKNPDFNLSTNNPAEEIKNASFEGIPENKKAALQAELKTMSRLFKISGDYNHLAVLYGDKLDSATSIVHRHSRKSFINTYGDKLGIEKAETIYRNAREMDNKSTAIALNYQKKSDVPIYVMHGPNFSPSSDYQSMFGDNNLCQCDHCQSVYSPSAYLVDILNFLRLNDPVAFSKLDERRPDIKNIQLTCENTNTPLPYIDLVNEILEDKIAPPNPASWHQTTLTAAELAAYPEHTNEAAYTILATASSSLQLPLDLPLEQTRLCLAKLGLKRHELMELFSPAAIAEKYSDVDIAMEYLQISTQEAALLTATVPVVMDKVTDFLQLTSLGYVELLQLLECYYINPVNDGQQRQITITGPEGNPVTCNINELNISGATDSSRQRIWPFLRLWKKTGWTMIELDKTLMAFGATSLSTDIIVKISHVARLREKYSLDVSTILALWADIDTGKYVDQAKENTPAIPSLYEQLFLNKKLKNPVDENFRDPFALSGTLLDVVPNPLPGINNPATITAALSLTQKDFEAWVALTDGSLHLHNLSVLYRYGVLSRLLRLSAEDFLTIVSLTGLSPFTEPVSTASIFAFIEKVELIRASGFSVQDLKSMLTPIPGSDVNPEEKKKQRLSRLLNKLKITTAEYVYLQDEDNAAKLNIAGIWELPTANMYLPFENLLYLTRFRDLVKATADWYKMFDLATQPEFIQSFIALTQMSQADVDFLVQEFGFIFPADFYKGKNLYQLAWCGLKIAETGSTAQQLFSFAAPAITEEHANLSMSLLKSRYDEATWLEVIKPLSNQLRIRKRNALTAHIIDNSPEFNSTDDLFHHFLVDTEIAVCAKTSRIKQAISSVQLFVNRCLLNLEEGIALDTAFATQWNEWRKMYRVWEANRKIFLYPENWIEPGLRDDKTPLFVELESKLLQNEVTDVTAREALLGYLEKLDAIAQLEIVALFADSATGITHVVGRTPSNPYEFYYRCQKQNTWSNWEKIEADIEGDHILLTVWNNRVIVFWGLFTEKQEELQFVTPGTGQALPVAGKYFEMRLSWSENKNGKWKKKKIAKQPVSFPVAMKLSQISLQSSIKQGELWITAFGSYPPDRQYINSLGLFSHIFDGCHADPRILQHGFGNSPYFTTLLTAFPENMLLGEKFSNSDITLDVFNTGFYHSGNAQTSRLFNNTPGRFTVLPEHQEIATKQNVHFFYSNGKHVFYSRSVGGFRIPDVTIEPTGGILTMRKVFVPGDFQTAVTTNGTVALPNDPTKRIFAGKKYIFQAFYHPYVCNFVKVLNAEGINGLYREEVQNRQPVTVFTTTNYNPSLAVKTPYPVEKIDFDISGTYSAYNWELFFHIPLLIATHLSKNQQFAEAQKWFHYIFDPTRSTDDASQGMERFWRPQPFKNEILNEVLTIDQLLDGMDPAELNAQLNMWHNNPFNPHAIARIRISAYMRNTVMKYIDNLIAWGDQLFQRDTLESINEATLLYILAANTLGRKPTVIPPRTIAEVQSFDTIKDKLDAFSNAKVAIQSFIAPSGEPDTGPDTTPLMPLFCLPPNDKLLGYWDTVADRLFKIRNCMNIQGVVRQLPLFEAPLDPALLVKAAAAGLDLATVIDDVTVDLAPYRFQVILQRANELCNDVKNFGASLVSALEKKDAEALALLRNSHELAILQLTKDIKRAQYQETKHNLANLEKMRASVEFRRDYYLNRPFTNSSEKEFFQKSKVAMISQEVQQAAEMAAGLLFKVPNTTAGAWSWGITTGGQSYGAAASAIARAAGGVAAYFTHEAAMANTRGSFERRQDDWIFLGKQAEQELEQLDQQIAAAELRVAIAEKDLESHELQIENSREVDDFHRDKFTNAELYDYMAGQLSTVYFQSYQLAYRTAKKAEKCMQHELGLAGTSFIQFGHWDSLKKGLMSGEKLQLDLRRLENAYMEENKREYEIVKNISLVNLDPLAIIKLRETGSCDISIPEVIYDMDYAGQYFRRLKSVSISIPCIAGPYTSISAKLSLQNSRYRKNTTLSPSYNEEPGSDTRFVYMNGTVQSIATSNAQNDSGIFELNFRDERYLPFEGAGAIGQWKLELPTVARQFDYSTITDVIVHIKYTAREGGDELKASANNVLVERLNELAQQLGEEGLHLPVILKHDMPNEWHKLQLTGSATLKIERARLPYVVQSFNVEVEQLLLIGKCSDDPASFAVNIDGSTISLSKIEGTALCKGVFTGAQLNTAFLLSVDEAVREKLEELVLVVKYVI